MWHQVLECLVPQMRRFTLRRVGTTDLPTLLKDRRVPRRVDNLILFVASVQPAMRGVVKRVCDSDRSTFVEERESDERES